MNRNTNPSAHKQAALYVIRVPYIVASHLKILIPVGTAIIIVVDVKYACVFKFHPDSAWKRSSQSCVKLPVPNVQ